MFYTLLSDWFAANTFVNFVVNFLLSGTFALTAITVAYSRKIDFVQAIGIKNKKINGKIVWLCFLISLVSIIGFGDITSLFMDIMYACGYESVLPAMVVDSFWKYLGYVVVTCVTPAICEEILFRGTILSGLKQHGIKVAVFGSAVIFMLMHGNAEQTVHQLIVGILIGYVFFKSGNLWLGSLIHFFNNFIAISVTYFVSVAANGEEVVEETTKALTATDLISSIISTAIFVWFGYYLIKLLIDKLLKEDQKINENSDKQESLKLQSITVDGEEKVVEMVIEGDPAATEQPGETNESIQEKKEPIKTSTIVMFALAGLYLVGNWFLALLTGLGV